ncbi:MAG: DUF4340 domain-containing protein [Planctomycetota bacterium]
MSNKKLATLGLVALVMVLWAVVQSRISTRPGGRENLPKYLIQGFKPELITSIVIQGSGKTVTLNRGEDGFVITEKEYYTADTSQINKLITECLDIQTVELYTTDKTNHKDLGVTEEDARRVVKFFGKDSALLTGVVIGKEKELSIGTSRIMKGTYVRQLSNDQVLSDKVYVATDPSIRYDPIDYIDSDIFTVNRDDIVSVVVSSPNDVYTLKKNDNGAVEIDNIPAGKILKDSDAGDVFGALTNMSFVDVQRDSDVGKRFNYDRKYVCNLKDSTIYSILIAKQGERIYAKCSAEFSDMTEVVKESRVETEDELKAKETKLLGQENTARFTGTHTGWIYELSGHRGKYLVKELTDLFEDEPEPEPLVDPNSVNTIADPNT